MAKNSSAVEVTSKQKIPIFLGSKLGLNCPLEPCYNRTIHQYFLDSKFQLLGICCSRLYLEEITTFFGSRSNWNHFRGFGGNDSSKQRQIELKLGPPVVLIVVQLYSKHYGKLEFLQRLDVPKVWVLGPTLTTIYPLQMVEIKNSHQAIQMSQNQGSISFPFSMKAIITFCSIWAIFSKIKKSQLRLAPLFQKPLIKG